MDAQFVFEGIATNGIVLTRITATTLPQVDELLLQVTFFPIRQHRKHHPRHERGPRGGAAGDQHPLIWPWRGRLTVSGAALWRAESRQGSSYRPLGEGRGLDHGER